MNRRDFLNAGTKAAALIPVGVTVLSGLSAMSCSTISMPGFGGGGRGGSEWIGRRYFTRQTRFWGYVKKENEPWSKARLVIINERHKHTPDRLSELATGERGHGFDHNYEYRLNGTFSGNEVYDPNSDKILPEFVLRDYQLISKTPGHLFNANESYSAYKLPPRD